MWCKWGRMICFFFFLAHNMLGSYILMYAAYMQLDCVHMDIHGYVYIGLHYRKGYPLLLHGMRYVGRGSIGLSFGPWYTWEHLSMSLLIVNDMHVKIIICKIRCIAVKTYQKVFFMSYLPYESSQLN